MSHEVIQVIILVKYVKRSHEIIKIKHKYLLTMVNKEKDKSKHSHEMTRFWNRIGLWFSLHEPVRISGSSYGSIFKLPAYQIHNEYESESSITDFGSHEQVWIVATCNQTHKLIRIYTHTHIHNTLTHMHACTLLYNIQTLTLKHV